MSLLHTSSQTAGPYLAIGFRALARADIVADGSAGALTLEGRVLDGDGIGIGDAAVEVWQADIEGRYADASSRGFGRVLTDAAGRFAFRTVKPGRVPAADGAMQAPHLAVTVFMRGSLKALHTRVYFAEPAANADDPVLRRVAAERRATLVATPAPGDPARLAWDIHLQGALETVFFEF